MYVIVYVIFICIVVFLYGFIFRVSLKYVCKIYVQEFVVVLCCNINGDFKVIEKEIFFSVSRRRKCYQDSIKYRKVVKMVFIIVGIFIVFVVFIIVIDLVEMLGVFLVFVVLI